MPSDKQHWLQKNRWLLQLREKSKEAIPVGLGGQLLHRQKEQFRAHRGCQFHVHMVPKYGHVLRIHERFRSHWKAQAV